MSNHIELGRLKAEMDAAWAEADAEYEAALAMQAAREARVAEPGNE